MKADVREVIDKLVEALGGEDARSVLNDAGVLVLMPMQAAQVPDGGQGAYPSIGDLDELARVSGETLRTKPEHRLRQRSGVVMNTYEQIVRELAETDPVDYHQDLAGEPVGCNFCNAVVRGVMLSDNPNDGNTWVLEREDHLTDCLWLRAMQAVERADNPSIGITIHDRKPEPEVIVVPVPIPAQVEG
jgi:hypothetical protein